MDSARSYQNEAIIFEGGSLKNARGFSGWLMAAQGLSKDYRKYLTWEFYVTYFFRCQNCRGAWSRGATEPNWEIAKEKSFDSWVDFELEIYTIEVRLMQNFIFGLFSRLAKVAKSLSRQLFLQFRNHMKFSLNIRQIGETKMIQKILFRMRSSNAR